MRGVLVLLAGLVLLTVFLLNGITWEVGERIDDSAKSQPSAIGGFEDRPVGQERIARNPVAVESREDWLSTTDNPPRLGIISGRVLDNDRVPVRNGKIVLHPFGESKLTTVLLSTTKQGLTLSNSLQGVTDLDGYFRINVRIGETYHLRVEAESWSEERWPVAEGGFYLIVRGEESCITIQILCQDHSACLCEGIATVRSAGRSTELASMTVTTSMSLALNGIRPGTYIIWVECAQHLVATSDPFLVGQGGEYPIVVKCQAVDGVDGILLDSQTGLPINQGRVSQYPSLRDPAVSDVSGQFRLDNLSLLDFSTSTIPLFAIAPGYPSSLVFPSIEAGVNPRIKVRLSRGVTMKGVVLDNANNSVPHAQIEVFGLIPTSSRLQFNFAEDHLIANADGEYQFQWDAMRDTYIRATATGYAPTVLRLDCAKAETEVVPIILQPACKLQVHIQSDEARPIANAEIELANQVRCDLLSMASSFRGDVMARYVRVDERGFTDSNGDLTITICPNTAYMLHVWIGGEKNAYVVPITTDTKALQFLTVTMPDATTLWGVVQLLPVEDRIPCTLVLTDKSSDRKWSLRVLSNEPFAFDAIVPNELSVHLEFRRSSGLIGSLDLPSHPTDRPLNVFLPATRVVDGRVLSTSGVPVDNATVFCNINGGGFGVACTSGSEGAFAFRVFAGVSLELKVASGRILNPSVACDSEHARSLVLIANDP